VTSSNCLDLLLLSEAFFFPTLKAVCFQCILRDGVDSGEPIGACEWREIMSVQCKAYKACIYEKIQNKYEDREGCEEKEDGENDDDAENDEEPEEEVDMEELDEEQDFASDIDDVSDEGEEALLEEALTDGRKRHREGNADQKKIEDGEGITAYGNLIADLRCALRIKRGLTMERQEGSEDVLDDTQLLEEAAIEALISDFSHYCCHVKHAYSHR